MNSLNIICQEMTMFSDTEFLVQSFMQDNTRELVTRYER